VTGDIVAIVPVKCLADAKGRLAGRLSPAERVDFTLESLERVLRAIETSRSVGVTLVVSPDARVQARAIAAGADAVGEAKGKVVAGGNDDSHNRALEHARAVAIDRWQPAALLVLAADLPLVTAHDVTSLIALGDARRCVVLAPDRAGSGTNGLLLRPPDALPFRFGRRSFQQHAAEAERRGLDVHVFRSVGTSHDVDVPGDLEEAFGR
jgi:2-phospho-L-lactate guanylyltransferase